MKMNDFVLLHNKYNRPLYDKVVNASLDCWERNDGLSDVWAFLVENW